MKKAGWIISALVALFMLGASAAPKLLGVEAASQSMEQLGWPSSALLLIGIIELVCALLFLLPRTALLGAILLTAIYGAAVATHWRVGNPIASHTLFSVYLGVFTWAGLWLRDERFRAALRPANVS